MARRTVDGPSPGFHAGEIAVQRLAGVATEAQHLVGMLDPAELVGGVVGFLAERTLAVLTARDPHGALWASPLVGPEGFLRVTGRHQLHVETTPRTGDPLSGLTEGQDVALIAMEFAKRRRFRVNGRVTGSDANSLTIEVEQAYGNCPLYIQARTFTPVTSTDEESVGAPDPALGSSDRFHDEDVAQITAADTFFFGTIHPTRGADASHRGGAPGFVRLQDDRTLWWPDYPGNNMFNSLGNLAVDPAAAMLFIDFATGRTLHLNGRAELETITVGGPGDDGQTGRRVRFHLNSRVIGAPLAQRANDVSASPRNPALIG